MKTLVLFLLAVNLIGQNAFAGSLEGCGALHSDYWDNCDEFSSATGLSTIYPTVTTTQASDNLSARHNKIVAAAQEDAQYFVASEGRAYGVQLASAIRTLRAELPQLANANDMEIAQLILGQ